MAVSRSVAEFCGGWSGDCKAVVARLVNEVRRVPSTIVSGAQGAEAADVGFTPDSHVAPQEKVSIKHLTTCV